MVKLVSYFASALTKHDQRIHRKRIGSARGQQTWECLAYLVALRAWQEFWLGRKFSVAIRSHNLGALFMGAQMRSTASPVISKEVALLYGEGSFEPRVFQHLPGIANVVADVLSRMAEPGNVAELPDEVVGIAPVVVPVRTKSYYRTLTTK